MSLEPRFLSAADACPADFAQSEHPALMPGSTYRNMWWVTHNEHGAFMARGVHGQAPYIDPRAEKVIARFASLPVAVSPVPIGNTMAGLHALARHLME
jgi:CubicO group peptidase (beta-lactamase class C family)